MGLAILKFLASRKTAIISVLVSLLLFLTGEGADAQIADTFRIPLERADHITDVAKFLVTVLAATGFSMLPNPRRFEDGRHDPPAPKPEEPVHLERLK